MLNLQQIYNNYQTQTPEQLIALMKTALCKEGVGFSNSISKVRSAIKIAREYTNNHQKDPNAMKNENGEFIRISGEPYINHTLRVALILLHERMFDLDALLAAIMHDLYEDTTYTYDMAKEAFGYEVAELINSVTNVSTAVKNFQVDLSMPEEINYSSLIQKCAKRKIGFFIKFADRLDNLLTISSMPREKQLKKVQDTRQYIIPMIDQLEAHRFRSLIDDAIYRIEQPEEYEYIENCIKQGYIFESTYTTFKCLRKEYKGGVFEKVHVLNPTVYEIATQLRKTSEELSFEQSQIVYNVYLLAKVDADIPTVADVIRQFHKSDVLSDCVITQIYSDGFEFEDRINNHYKVTIISTVAYNLFQYGNTENEILVTDESTIDDDLASEHIVVYTPELDEVFLPVGSTVIDFAFRIHTEIGKQMICGIRNGKEISPATELHNKDTVRIVTASYPDGSQVKVNWLLACKTRLAKKSICRIIQSQLDQKNEIIEELKNQIMNLYNTD